MKKALNFILLWLVLFLSFQVFACKSVQKGAKDEPGETAVTKTQTNSTATGKATAKDGSTGTVKKTAVSAETSKKKAVNTDTDKSKQGKLAVIKEEVIMEAEKILNPTVRKAILPSGVGLLILASLMSSKRERRRKDY